MASAQQQSLSSDTSVTSAAIPDGWLPAAAAAPLLGLKARAVRNRCQRGLLRAVRGGPGAPGWWIDPECSPALRLATDRPAGIAPAGSELAGLTDAQRQRAFGRLRVVQAYLAGLDCKPGLMSTREFICRFVDTWNRSNPSGADPRVSRSALYGWIAAYRKAGVCGLIDRRGGARTAAPFSPEARDFILGMYLGGQRDGLPMIYVLARAQAREHGWQLPALRTVQMWIRTKVDPKLLAAGRDPKRFRDRCLPYIRRDGSRVPAMQAWVGDHRLADVWLPRKVFSKAKGREVVSWARPWLTCFMDCRSWMPVGWRIAFDAPNGQRVASAFLAGVDAHGAPDHAILDNGKDFRAHEVAGSRSRRRREKLFDERRTTPLLEALGVTVHWAIPHNPRAKTIERFFRIVAEQFDKRWPTYCAGRTEDRPESLKDLAAADVDLDLLSLDSFRAAFARWALEDYALSASPAAAAGGRSVMRAFHELRAPGFRVVKPAPETAALLLMRSRRVRVDRNGVYVPAFGRFYWSDALESRRCASGRDLSRHVFYRYRDGDPSRIFVFAAQGDSDRFLCVATPYVGDGLHPLAAPDSPEAEQVGDAMALQRTKAKAARDTVKEARKTALQRFVEAPLRAKAALGELDDPADILRAHPPAAATIKLMAGGELDRAAAAGRKHDAQQKHTRESATAFLAKTGTTDVPEPGQRTAATDALEELSVDPAANPESEEGREADDDLGANESA